MKEHFKQLDIKKWLLPINKAVAVIKYEPEYLEKKLPIVFSESFDDLDYFKIAVLELCSGKQFCLIRYRGNSSGGTEIWVSKDSLNFNLEINEILDALNLYVSDIKWILEASSDRFTLQGYD